MKIIITETKESGINIDLDDEALKLDDYALVEFLENAIHMLNFHASNIINSVE